MYTEIETALKEAGNDKNVVVTMLTGAGNYYCSGNDLSNFATIPPEGPQKLAAEGKEILRYIYPVYCNLWYCLLRMNLFDLNK